MRLDQISVDDYGPLSEELRLGAGLEVVYGPNESGKTLLVDALLLMLTGQNDDDRVGQDPIGYVRLEEDGGSRRLDDGETVMGRFEATHGVALGAGEFRNTFVVRGADSELTAEDDYYDRATDVVAESIVDDIDRVRRAVRGAGRVTPSGLLIDRSDETETRTHHSRAGELHGRIEAYLEEARASGLPALEADFFEAQQRSIEQTETVERLRAAERRHAFEAQSANRDRLAGVLDDLAGLPDEDDLEALGADVDDVVEGSADLDALESRRDQARANTRRAVVAMAIALVGGLAVGGWLLSAVGPSLVAFVVVGVVVAILTAVPGGIGLYFWRVRERADGQLAEYRSDRAGVLQRGRGLGVEADGVADLSVAVGELRDRHRRLRGRASELQGELSAVLSLDVDSPAEALELATQELDRRESDLPAADPDDFSEAALGEAETELERLEDERERLEGELDVVRTEIRQLVDEAADIPFTTYGIEAPSTTVETLEGLQAVAIQLETLLETIERDADNARVADDLLEELKEAEQRRIGELFFGAESAVTAYFSAITGGRYERVDYDEVDNELRVTTAKGSILSPGQLSQSTFDQLYFAVRVAFAEELLEDGTGFFVLDDAFLAADADRLDRQIDVLERLVGRGWQVVYFTAKDADRDALVDQAGASEHRLAPL